MQIIANACTNERNKSLNCRHWIVVTATFTAFSLVNSGWRGKCKITFFFDGLPQNNGSNPHYIMWFFTLSAVLWISLDQSCCSRFPVITQLFRDVQQKTQTNVPILPWRGFCLWSVLVWFLLRPIAAFKPHDSFLSHFCPPAAPPGQKEGVCSGHYTMQMDSGDAPGVVEEKKKARKTTSKLNFSSNIVSL